MRDQHDPFDLTPDPDNRDTLPPQPLTLNERRQSVGFPSVEGGDRSPRAFVVGNTHTGRRFAEDRFVKVELEVTPNWWRDGFSNSAAMRVMLRCAGAFPDAELRVSTKHLIVVEHLREGQTCEEICLRASELIAEFDVDGRYSGG